jgi:hypothetical protein
MKRPGRLTILLGAALWLFMGSTAAGITLTDRLELTGWADTVQSLRIHDPGDMLTSRARLRTELAAYLGAWYGFASADAEKNWEIDSETGVDLQEMWIEYAAAGWDLRVGRQIIIWGKADGVRITDNISPPDYTESMTRDLDEIRMAVDAAKFRLLGSVVDTELIWIPVFRAAVQPSGDNPWAVSAELPENVSVNYASAREPATTLENSELAMKVSAFFSAMDVAASVFYTWDDNAVGFRDVLETGDDIDIDYRPDYRRMTVFGLECARPWSYFVFRGEAAFYRGKYFYADSISNDPLKKNSLKWLAGADWSPGNDWSVTGQLIGEAIFDYTPDLAADRHALSATLNISKKLFHQTWTLSNMVYYDINGNEYFDRIKAAWDAADGLTFTVGADIFDGDDGAYGRYRDNSQAWIKVKYAY